MCHLLFFFQCPFHPNSPTPLDSPTTSVHSVGSRPSSAVLGFRCFSLTLEEGFGRRRRRRGCRFLFVTGSTSKKTLADKTREDTLRCTNCTRRELSLAFVPFALTTWGLQEVKNKHNEHPTKLPHVL